MSGNHVTLRSVASAPTPSTADLLATALSPDDTLRDSKQVLRSLYFACASVTSQDIPPPIAERSQRDGVFCEMTLTPKAVGSS